MTTRELGIIADDLTGAMDSSGYFAGQGWSALVVLDASYPLKGDVVTIDTNSRADNANTAREKVRKAVRNLPGRLVYKKIDSTLRGNVSVELEALMDELAPEKAIVVPAFPALGRTTVAGVMLVDGVRVSETQFAHDPVCPVKESHIPSLLRRSTQREIGCVTQQHIDRGPEELYRHISRMSQGIVACDVTTESQLACIAQAALLAKDRWLLCGSGGLARELNIFLPEASEVDGVASTSMPTGPVLVVAGSQNEVTARQLLRAKHELGLPIVNLEVENLNQENNPAGEIGRIVEAVIHILDNKRMVALSSAFSKYAPDLRHSLPAVIAKIVSGILDARRLAGLFLSGGDTAVEVCRRLSVRAISLRGEVEPGVPAGEFVGGQAQGIRVVTKAGGFGSALAIIRSLSYLEKGHLI